LKQSNAESRPQDAIPVTLEQPGVARFWLAVALTGIGAIVLTDLLGATQHRMWPDSAELGLVASAARTSAFHPVLMSLGAGLITGAGQLVLVCLFSGNGIGAIDQAMCRC